MIPCQELEDLVIINACCRGLGHSRRSDIGYTGSQSLYLLNHPVSLSVVTKEKTVSDALILATLCL